jgi:hypothetical protein
MVSCAFIAIVLTIVMLAIIMLFFCVLGSVASYCCARHCHVIISSLLTFTDCHP